jgi:glycosyltransferase involved in cell wall biosynthesis
MKVLLLSKALVVGAYQRKLEEIAALGVDLTVAVPPSWKDERGEIKLERSYLRGYRLVPQPIWFNGNFHLHFYPQLAALVRDVRPDVFHIDEEPYNFATYHALRIAQRHSIKTVFFSWQNLLRNYPYPFSAFEQYVLRYSDYAICGNQESVNVWRAKNYTGKVKVIPQFGVDPELFAPQAQTPNPNFTIAYAGRFVKEKGVEILLRAFARLPNTTHLKLLGSGPVRPALESLARNLQILDRVEFINWLPSTEFPNFLHTVNVLVLPSLTQPNWKEQFGRVLVEAMACGVPVIGSTCGEIPNVIGEAGLIVPEGDEAKLSEALNRLMTNETLRAELSVLGRTRVLARFTQKSIAAETVEVYKELASHEAV